MDGPKMNGRLEIDDMNGSQKLQLLTFSIQNRSSFVNFAGCVSVCEIMCELVDCIFPP